MPITKLSSILASENSKWTEFYFIWFWNSWKFSVFFLFLIDKVKCSAKTNKRVCHTVALPFTLKQSVFRQMKKNYENSNISLCKKYILQKKKSSERNQNHSRYHNSILTNLKFQHKPKYHLSTKKSSYKNRPIIIS